MTEVNRFRPGTKRHTIVEVMNANADKPMEDVLDLIVAATGCELRLAKHDYLWMSRERVAKGNPPARAARAPKVKAKTTAVKHKVDAEYIKKIRAAVKTVDPEIKKKNLAMLRAAGEARIAKVKAKVVDESYEAELLEDINQREEDRQVMIANIHPSLHKELGLV